MQFQSAPPGGTHNDLKYLYICWGDCFDFDPGCFHKVIALLSCFLDLWPYIRLKLIFLVQFFIYISLKLRWSEKWSENFGWKKKWSETGHFIRICGQHQIKSIGHTEHEAHRNLHVSKVDPSLFMSCNCTLEIFSLGGEGILGFLVLFWPLSVFVYLVMICPWEKGNMNSPQDGAVLNVDAYKLQVSAQDFPSPKKVYFWETENL